MFLGECRHARPGCLARQARPRTGIFDYAVFFKRRGHGDRVREFAVFRPNHRNDGDSVSAAKLEISFIVRRNSHDRSGAVTHQDEIADPNGDLPPVKRMECVAAGEQTHLFELARILTRR